MDDEKRIYPRTEIKWPVSVITAKGIIQGETKNISLNGAYICSDKALCPNDLLLLTVDGPSGSMQVVAQVVWSNRSACDERESPSGTGVKFMWSLPKTEPERMMWSQAGTTSSCQMRYLSKPRASI
jgi:hypothetical protein